MLNLLADLAQFLLRWLHVIAGIMWIGDSFLFMWLDRNLVPSQRASTPGNEAITGELWMVHSGGFYEVYKRKFLRPGDVPKTLHWFKWESYSTFLTGVCLLVLVYYLSGPSFLLNAASAPFGLPVSVAIAVLSLVGLWFLYDAVALTIYKRWSPPLWALAIAGAALVSGLAGWFGFFLNARAAYLHVGAALGTCMAANVFFRIIPAQRALLAATAAGTTPPVELGVRAKLRSTHNHYATLPLLLLMLSNHFPALYSARAAWLGVPLLFVLGVSVKHAMIAQNRASAIVWAAGLGALLGLFVLLTPFGQNSSSEAAVVPSDEAVMRIVQQRCSGCHSVHPSLAGLAAPPNGIVFENIDHVRQHQERVRVRVCETKTMPLGNLTQMTDAERGDLAVWLRAVGAIKQTP